ncbi:DEAD/DEAH box helicase [Cohnella sp. JJ-181]|uniref:DEAD/DEAH box helicase n=1 Tax=Cohnella rhizoplanae TaxID=2974897 RepID=UPI0022FF5E72|nr:DEAD/DEAH box helicase [Cohnella sp. JJ-181]CAI6042277.1 ATP-dependent RNA helicase DeaD [Cohnella sp. JJ-181]
MSEEQIERREERDGAPAEVRTEAAAEGVTAADSAETAGSVETTDSVETNESATAAGAAAAADAGAGNEVAAHAATGGAGAGNEAAETEADDVDRRTFAALGLCAELTAALAEAGMQEPTSVQSGVIPELLAGRDGVLRSPTGSGKTLAYLLPLLQLVDPAKRETQAIVIAPTQELAMQIVRVSEKYGEPLGVKTVALIGGAALSRQLDRMKGKPAIVVGTPGRVREVVSLRKLPLHGVRHVVVDETDRVFSLGGKHDVEFVLKNAAKDRQTVFVSATRSDTMRAAEAKWLRDPWETTVRQEQEPGLPPTIEHLYLVSDPRDKIDLVRRIVRTMKPASTLLFVNDIERIGELLAKLRFEGFAVDALYGDTPGRERGEVLRKFREGKTKLLIASDVAARGLDVQDLALVLQFEPALDADHYVHRAGRTGRMGRSGTSITIVTPKELFIMDKLGKQLRIEIRERQLAHGRLGGTQGEAKREPAGGERSGAQGGSAAGAGGAKGPRRMLSGSRPAQAAGAKAGARPQPGSAAGGARSATPQGSAGRAAAAGPRDAGAKRVDARPAAEQADSQAAGRKAVGAKRDQTAAGVANVAGRGVDKKPQPARTAPKAKENRERDRKNKGAPRWLKDKRANNDAQPE